MQFAGHLIVRLLVIFLGLFVAVIAASLFMTFGLLAGALSDFFAELYWLLTGTVQTDPHAHPADASPLVLLIVLLVGLFSSIHVLIVSALPVLLAIAVAEFMRWRGLTINLVLAGGVALAAGLGAHPGGGLPSQGTLVVLLATGFVGGFFYWLVAGRGAGRWLDRTEGPYRGRD
ncbi:MAG: hypothetical protein KDJ80_06045 [Nitratireductor sp.]|nr:hypothetical protein [Nitratireductor sp.]